MLGYAIAIPVAVFLVLVWALHAPIVSRPALRPAQSMGGSAVVLLAPLAAVEVSLTAVVAAIALACTAVVTVSTINGSTRASPRPRELLLEAEPAPR